MSKLLKFAPDCTRISAEHGFWDDKEKRDKGEMVALMVSELSEAVEGDRKHRTHTTWEIITVPDEIEEWKEVEGYDDYEVSNLGRVRSLDMQVWNGKKYYTKGGRILSAGLGGTGYYTVSLRGTSEKVAILVAHAFCEGYAGDLIVNHINGCKTDDYANNLEYTTPGENNQHAYSTGLKSASSILEYKDMVDIAHRAKNKEPHKQIHLDYPQVSLSRIKGISRSKEQWTETIEFELADTVIRVLDYVHGWGIDVVPREYRKPSTGNFAHDILRIQWYTILAFHEQVSGKDWGYVLAAIEAFCDWYKIDIEQYVQWKLRYNEGRPHRHGKKY